jgi:hypothetical protein
VRYARIEVDDAPEIAEQTERVASFAVHRLVARIRSPTAKSHRNDRHEAAARGLR